MTDTDTRDQAPELMPPGRAILTAAQLTGTEYTMWGPTKLTVYGTPDKPQLYAETPMRGQVSLVTNRADLARFARELLTFLGEANGIELPPWQPYNNGTGKRRWFLARGAGAESDRIPVRERYYFSATGTLVRYATMKGAQLAADRLNRQEAAA